MLSTALQDSEQIVQMSSRLVQHANVNEQVLRMFRFNTDEIYLPAFNLCLEEYFGDDDVEERCMNYIKSYDDEAKPRLEEDFGALIYQHVPLSVFTGVFTWIFWLIKWVVYLVDEKSVRSYYDGEWPDEVKGWFGW
mgnify:CR=1 FL=1